MSEQLVWWECSHLERGPETFIQQTKVNWFRAILLFKIGVVFTQGSYLHQVKGQRKKSWVMRHWRDSVENDTTCLLDCELAFWIMLSVAPSHTSLCLFSSPYLLRPLQRHRPSIQKWNCNIPEIPNILLAVGTWELKLQVLCHTRI